LQNEEVYYYKGIRKKVPQHLARNDRSKPLSANDISHIINRLRDAETEVQMLCQRHKNILNVIESIIRYQKGFFDTGDRTNLKPLIARDIASEVGLDESTVRRIRKDKFVQTPYGTFKLRFFFDETGFETQRGYKIASKGVKELIKRIIKSEDTGKPHTDQKITNILNQKHGIKIDRRMVSKYRETIGFFPARLRRWPC
jgi:RNA polymerase sigma-54 factor